MSGPPAVSRPRRESAAALAGFALVAFLYLAVRPLVEGGHQYVGFAYDPQIFIWAFAWWPHAILHGQNPFVSHAVWAPDGVDLMWSTTVPGLALLFWPLTALAGPIVAYDVAAVLMLALAAWTGFLLCRYVTHAFWPSLVGGYLFGFSSYQLAQDAYGGHLNLGSVFLLPLIALVVLRFLDGTLGGGQLVVRLAPLLVLQLLFSTELAFGAGLATATALLLGYLFVPARRARLIASIPALAGACLVAAVVTAPFLYYLLARGVRPPFYSSTSRFDADLANFVVPTKLTLGGGLFRGISSRFVGANVPEQGAYLGLPILVVVALYIRSRWRTPTARFLLAALAVTVVIALGSDATVAGHALFALPWRLVQHRPIFDNVLTNRFVVYATLITSVIVAIWMAARRSGLLRWALPTLAVVAITPNPLQGAYATTYHVPRFFTASVYRSCLDPGEIVLPFPTRGGSALLWQVESKFRFNLAAGDIGPDIPASFFTPAAIAPVAGGSPLGVDQAPILRQFLALKHVTSVVADESQANQWAGALDQIAEPHVVGGVYLYHLTAHPPSCLNS